MKEFEDFVELCKLSKANCPWAKSQDGIRFAEEMKVETDEVLEAIRKGDKEHIQEELGDVLLDLVHTCVSEGLDIQDVVKCAHAKLNRRKPFLKEGRQVSLDEAKAIWKQAKEK